MDVLYWVMNVPAKEILRSLRFVAPSWPRTQPLHSLTSGPALHCRLIPAPATTSYHINLRSRQPHPVGVSRVLWQRRE
ncbi:hypothetical protein O3P69_000918 [Scylla paramamosain]|uniref:Uncharacterized protein n=1 Tax=Scylla paramamosain TaxID=85552 RepID=A0AAW0USA7_SCYPA